MSPAEDLSEWTPYFSRLPESNLFLAMRLEKSLRLLNWAFMKSALYALLPLLSISPGWTHAADDSFHAPDALVLKSGRTVKGLIIRNSANDVLLQERYEENLYPKSAIERILDVPDLGTEFTEVSRKGRLPAWRTILNDLRTNDAIHSLREIPAVTVDEGIFRNVPYTSYRANGIIELNIYGDPENPAGIEFGIYGPRQNNVGLRKVIRSYLSGFLNTRAELAALYGIGLKEGIRQADRLTFEVTPRTAPDAFGAWWISIYDKKTLDAVRLSDAKYHALTLPSQDILGARGRVKDAHWVRADLRGNPRLDDQEDRIIPRGFYRDSRGVFRLLGSAGAPSR